MIALIKRYCLQIVFAICVLIGLQLPHFLQQYELRLQGHFIEASRQLAEYQSLADKHYAGDLQALINQHQQSDTAVFREQADIIKGSDARVRYLQQKIAQLSSPIWVRLGLLTKEIGRPIFNETWRHYQANIVLNYESLSVGVVVAVLLMLSIEFTLYLLTRLFGLCYRRTNKSL